MADSKKLTTLKALCAFLAAEVSVANGYKHDLAGAVFRGRMFSTNNDPLPMVTLLENLDPDRYPRQAGGENQHVVTNEDWVLLVQGWAIDDKENPCDTAYELMADVRKALAKLKQRPHPVTGGPENPNYLLGG